MLNDVGYIMKGFDRGLYDAWLGCQLQSRIKLEEVVQHSHVEPASFWKELSLLYEEVTGLKTQSVDLSRYHLYHDCITRHLGKRRIAFKMANEGAFLSWTFEQIDRYVNFQVDRWGNSEILAGHKIAIVMPVGIYFIVTMLTALRLGVQFTFLPLDTPALSHRKIAQMIDQLDVDLIVTTSTHAAFINQSQSFNTSSPGSKYWLVDYLEEKSEAKLQRDFIASNGDVAESALICQGQVVDEMRPVTYQEITRSVLRDGFLLLGLKPGMVWGYTAQCSLREQPLSLLTALFHGATTVLFSEADVTDSPQLLEDEAIDVLGISPEMKKRWLEAKGFPKHKPKLCYRYLFDREDERTWDLFKEKWKLEKTPFSRFLFDQSQGGITFFSIPSTEKFDPALFFSMGVPWEMLQTNALREKAINGFGIAEQLPAIDTLTSYSASNFIVTQYKGGVILVDTVQPNVKGYTISLAQIEEIASSCEFVDKSVLLTLNTPGYPLNPRTVLLLFVNPPFTSEIEKQKKAWTLHLLMQIKESLGAIFVPECFEFYPFSPLIEGDEVNRSWCAQQYVSGMFARKRGMKAYELIHHLRSLLT